MDSDERQVAGIRTDPAATVPEADLLEQRADLDPRDGFGPPAATATTKVTDRLADEADLLEQATPVPDDENDDFPYDL